MAGLRRGAAPIAAHVATNVLLYLNAQQVQALAAIFMRNEDGAFVVTIAWTAGARLRAARGGAGAVGG